MRELNRPPAKHDQILQRVLRSLSLFDAAPFLAFPHLALQSALDLILRRSCPEHPQDQHRGEAIIRDLQRNVSRLRC